APRPVRTLGAGAACVARRAGSQQCRPARGVERQGWTASRNRRVPGQRRGAQREEVAVDRAAKKELLTTLNGGFKDTNVVVVAHYSGLNVAQMQTLRRQMKQAGAAVKVAKNRLAKLALEDTDAAVIIPLLKGPTLIAYSGDPVVAPKVAAEFAKANEKFVIL